MSPATRNDAQTGSATSILQALGGEAAVNAGPAKSGVNRPGVWLFAAGAVLAVAAAAWVGLGDRSPQEPIAAAPVAVKPVEPVATAPAPVPAPAPAPAPTPAPANLMTDAREPGAGTAAPADGAVARLEQLASTDVAAPAAVVPASRSEPPAIAAPKTPERAASKPPAPKAVASASRGNNGATATKLSNVAKTTPPKPRASSATAASKTVDARAVTDPDVEIVAALMGHGKPSSGTAAAALPPRQQATIAGLVASCRSKPRAEAEQCRREICDGYWGKAQACAKQRPAASPLPPP